MCFGVVNPPFTTMFLKALSTPTFVEMSRLRGLTGPHQSLFFWRSFANGRLTGLGGGATTRLRFRIAGAQGVEEVEGVWRLSVVPYRDERGSESQRQMVLQVASRGVRAQAGTISSSPCRDSRRIIDQNEKLPPSKHRERRVAKAHCYQPSEQPLALRERMPSDVATVAKTKELNT